MTLALVGEGSILIDGHAAPAADALRAKGLSPLVLGPKDGLSLLNGTQASTAMALMALFDAEEIFAAAVATGAMSIDAAKASDTPFDARIQRVRRHRGQTDVDPQVGPVSDRERPPAPERRERGARCRGRQRSASEVPDRPPGPSAGGRTTGT